MLGFADSESTFSTEYDTRSSELYRLKHIHPDSNLDTGPVVDEGGTRGLSGQSSLSVLDVAAYILESMGAMSTMKLQKLVYYCQAWSLVWEEAPLFSEPIEAWANGPVVRRLFDHHRGQYRISKILTGNPRLLSEQQKETVDVVLAHYGSLSAQELIEQSHSEKPWIEARIGMNPLERGQRRIELDQIQEYFSAVAAN